VSRAYLGLGGNLGDRLAALQRAVDLLDAAAVRTIASSRVWETDPVGGPPGQPRFLNAVVRVETDMAPTDLLAACERVEAALGRVRDVRWGPRTIDVDVLLYDDVTSTDPQLTIPHPRMAERSFVVLPLLDIDPDPVLPDGTRLLDRRTGSGDDGARPVAPPLRLP
jgi:2-amino-4-hydroxy-6-hydroxymethyldihydropteridine diphosphokinase